MSDTAIVLDLGAQTLKAGYSYGWPNPEEPRLVTPLAASSTTSPSSPPRYAIHQGTITDWDVLETIIHYTLYQQLDWIEGGEGNLLCVEPSLTSRRDRELLTQLFFEVFNVGGYVATDAAMASLTAMGKLSGTVVDIGHDKIDIVPVLDGTTQVSSATRIPVGGVHLTQHLQKLLKDRNITISEEEAEKMKISCIQITSGQGGIKPVPFGTNGEAATSEQANQKKREQEEIEKRRAQYMLPDGQVIEVRQEGCALGDALLDPSLLGFDAPPLAESILTTATTIQVGDKAGPTRKVLSENIFVCGGGSLIPGLHERLSSQLIAAAHPSVPPSLMSIPEYLPLPKATQRAAWLGGSLLAKVAFAPTAPHAATQQMTKADYEEYGPQGAHRKFGA